MPGFSKERELGQNAHLEGRSFDSDCPYPPETHKDTVTRFMWLDGFIGASHWSVKEKVEVIRARELTPSKYLARAVEEMPVQA